MRLGILFIHNIRFDLLTAICACVTLALEVLSSNKYRIRDLVGENKWQTYQKSRLSASAL